MLETVIAERRIPPVGESAQVTSPRSDQAPQSPQKPLSRSATITASANQRLRGLLSGRSPTLDKMMGPPRKETPPLPHVFRSSSPGPKEPSASTSATSLLSVSGTHALSSASASTITLVDGGGGVSGVGLPLAPPESSEPRTSSGAETSVHPGFRRIESQGNDEVVSETTEVERNLPCEDDGETDGDAAPKTASKQPE